MYTYSSRPSLARGEFSMTIGFTTLCYDNPSCSILFVVQLSAAALRRQSRLPKLIHSISATHHPGSGVAERPVSPVVFHHKPVDTANTSFKFHIYRHALAATVDIYIYHIPLDRTLSWSGYSAEVSFVSTGPTFSGSQRAESGIDA